MREAARIIGVAASAGTVVLWFILNFANPYTHELSESDVIWRTFLFLCAPACLAFVGALIRKSAVLFIAFVWSLPISLYLSMTPGMFKWFGVTSLSYLVAGIWMRAAKVKHVGK
jgi:hypothetical protein